MFLVSVVLAISVAFAFHFLYNLVAFWLLDYKGVMRISIAVLAFFSGLYIPIRFFPDWLQTLAYMTPFPSMVQLPIDVFVGYTTGAEPSPRSRCSWAGRPCSSLPATPRSCGERESWSCRVAESLTLYARLVSARVRAQWQYRASFVLDVVGVFLVTFLDFLAILVIFHNVPQLGGWTVQEVALLYGISGVAFALTGLAVGQLDLLSQLIRDGNFDLVLIRPRRSLLQVLASDFHLRRLGRVAQAVSCSCTRSSRSTSRGRPAASQWSRGRARGAAIFAAVWVAAVCIVFWSVEGRESVSAVTDAGGFLSQYPIDVYASWLQRLVTVALPMAFVAYYPALYILDKPDPFDLPDWVPFASPVVALVAAVVAAFVWRFAVRHYRSAGG